MQWLLVASKLPREKTFDTLNLDHYPVAARKQVEALRSGAFLAGAVNVIAIGRPGTGKSHLTAALGHELVAKRHSVLWTPTFALVQRLLAAKRDLRLPKELAKLDRVECLILDDIGYVQQDREEMEVLFTLLAERYERRSTVISTNLVFSVSSLARKRVVLHPARASLASLLHAAVAPPRGMAWLAG